MKAVKLTKKEKSVVDNAWALIRALREPDRYGDDKKSMSPKIAHLVNELADSLDEMEGNA